MNHANYDAPFFPINGSISFYSPAPAPNLNDDMVGENDPACSVMTDFQVTKPVTIESTVSIDLALRKMIDSGVRMLLVSDAAGSIAGAITSYDIQGEKPVRYTAASGTRHNDILVGMIMTPIVQMPAFELHFVQRSRVSHLVAAMQELGQQHVLVIDYEAENNAQVIRGLFSTTHISRMLGRDITTCRMADKTRQITGTHRVINNA